MKGTHEMRFWEYLSKIKKNIELHFRLTNISRWFEKKNIYQTNTKKNKSTSSNYFRTQLTSKSDTHIEKRQMSSLILTATKSASWAR